MIHLNEFHNQVNGKNEKIYNLFLLIQISFSQINPGEVIWEEDFDNLDNWIIEIGNGSWGWNNVVAARASIQLLRGAFKI